MNNNHLRIPEEKTLSVSKTTVTIARDLVSELETFGIDTQFLNVFETDINETEALYDENKEKYDLKYLTAIKKEALEVCYKWNTDVKLRIELAYGLSSIEYISFPSKLLTAARSSDTKLSSVMETIIDIATEYAARLVEFGQTAAVLAEGSSLLDALRTAANNQSLKKVNKKKATQIRHEKFYHLYTTVNKINKVGRTLYKNNPVHYVLFESRWGTHSGKKVKTYKGEIQPSAHLVLAEGLLADRLIYMENTGDTDVLFFCGIKSEENPGITLSPGEEATLSLEEIGIGNNVSVENLSFTKSGHYTVKV